jgi:putative oxidoreductase
VNGRAPTLVLWILQILLAAVFFMAGGSKLTGVMPAVDMYSQIGWGQWFRYVTGIIEVGSAVMLLVPLRAMSGAGLLICTMTGAIVAHLTVLHTLLSARRSCLLSGVVAWLRRPHAQPVRA